MYVKRKIATSIILKFAWKNLLFFTIWSSIIVWVHHYYSHVDSSVNISIPFLPLSTIGIAVAFYVGFKNNSSYDRFWEARKIWGGIVNYSRTWGNHLMSFVSNHYTEGDHSDEIKAIQKVMMYRHIAWLNALRLQLRMPSSFSIKFKKSVRSFSKGSPERKHWDEEVEPFLENGEYGFFSERANPATQIIRKQGDNELIKQYTGFEPRASLRLSLSESFSMKMGYNKMYQYIHLVSNTTTIAPTDVWKLSDAYLKPQEVTQYSGGLFKNFKENTIEASVEVFYKDLNNILDYKDGATLILNDNLESDLLNGIGRAYGVELYLEKKTGKFTGWMSYTYSRSERKVVGSFPEEIINDGEWYASNFDKPHSFSIVGDYKLGKRTKLSSIFTYSTGRPTTYPVAKFNYQDGTNIAYYDFRNTFRVPDYHRLDLSLTFGWDTDNKWLSGDWVLSIYNVYGRKNAFSVFFDDIPGAPPQAFRLSVLGIAFPSISYNFEF